VKLQFIWGIAIFSYIQQRRAIMTVERGILLVVGIITLSTVVLAVYHNINWLWVTGVLGVHLIQASVTGMCPVVMSLKKLGFESKAGFAK
jgi:hypothetical protein